MADFTPNDIRALRKVKGSFSPERFVSKRHLVSLQRKGLVTRDKFGVYQLTKDGRLVVTVETD